MTESITKNLIMSLKKDLKKKSKAQLAREIGLKPMTLGRIISGDSAGHINSWQSIEKYYRTKTA